MAARTDIIETGNFGDTEEVPKYLYPFNILLVCRLLTKDHGPGNPSLMPMQIRSMDDVKNLKPYQNVWLQDEHGNEREYVIDYSVDVVSGQDLIDNTTPARLEAILAPADSTSRHELGLLDHMSHQIAVGHCLSQAIDRGVEMDTNLSGLFDAAENYFVELLDDIEAITSNQTMG
ncbi:MAG: hypothetical protein Q8M16_11590 [Pirellulaceae bacterium]|nr:hypothetical protein [Pirellulaceae bacterium]